MRTTDKMIDSALRQVTDALSEAAGRPVAVTLHRGNGTYKIHNVLIVNGMNLFRDGIGGTTAGDCYRALSNMYSVLSAVADAREMTRVPNWDCETEAFALSDCKYWDTPGHECAGPRVGREWSGVITCERHHNEVEG